MKNAQRHIAILCSRLDLPGGIERAIVNTAGLFVSKGNKVTLAILDETAEQFYGLDARVNIVLQSLSFGITSEGNIITRKIRLLTDILKLRKILRQINADIVIATEYPFSIAALLTGIRKKSKLISWEHHHFFWLEKNQFWSRLYNLAYPRFDNIVCLNNSEAVHYKKIAPVSVIPNFVDNVSAERATGEAKIILSVGHLIPRKGIDMMMKVAAEILHRYPGWKWKLIGDGEMKQEVLQFIKSENLEDRFLLQAPSKEIEKEYRGASFFVLTSRFEAFPMVLLEAQSFGLPLVSFDCPSGPAEIIEDRRNGLLIKDGNVQSMISGIASLIGDENKRKEMAAGSFEFSKKFSSENIYVLWEELLEKM